MGILAGQDFHAFGIVQIDGSGLFPGRDGERRVDQPDVRFVFLDQRAADSHLNRAALDLVDERVFAAQLVIGKMLHFERAARFFLQSFLEIVHRLSHGMGLGRPMGDFDHMRRRSR